jgi:hypothetical protein
VSVKSDPVPPSDPLGLRPQGLPNFWDDMTLQKLWLATQRRSWRSLAVVGAGARIDTLWIAELIAKLAWGYRGQPSCVFDLRDLRLRLVEYHEREVNAQVNVGQCVVIALRSVFENPTTVPMARSADAVVLCITLGKTGFKEAEQTLAEIGRDRVIGTIVTRQRRSVTMAGKSDRVR